MYKVQAIWNLIVSNEYVTIRIEWEKDRINYNVSTYYSYGLSEKELIAILLSEADFIEEVSKYTSSIECIGNYEVNRN